MSIKATRFLVTLICACFCLSLLPTLALADGTAPQPPVDSEIPFDPDNPDTPDIPISPGDPEPESPFDPIDPSDPLDPDDPENPDAPVHADQQAPPGPAPEYLALGDTDVAEPIEDALLDAGFPEGTTVLPDGSARLPKAAIEETALFPSGNCVVTKSGVKVQTFGDILPCAQEVARLVNEISAAPQRVLNKEGKLVEADPELFTYRVKNTYLERTGVGFYAKDNGVSPFDLELLTESNTYCTLMVLKSVSIFDHLNGTDAEAAEELSSEGPAIEPSVSSGGVGGFYVGSPERAASAPGSVSDESHQAKDETSPQPDAEANYPLADDPSNGVSPVAVRFTGDGAAVPITTLQVALERGEDVQLDSSAGAQYQLNGIPLTADVNGRISINAETLMIQGNFGEPYFSRDQLVDFTHGGDWRKESNGGGGVAAPVNTDFPDFHVSQPFDASAGDAAPVDSAGDAEPAAGAGDAPPTFTVMYTYNQILTVTVPGFTTEEISRLPGEVQVDELGQVVCNFQIVGDFVLLCGE